MDRATTVSDALKRQRLLAAQAIRKANDISPQTVRHLKDQRSPKHPPSTNASMYAFPVAASEVSPQQKSLNITELEEEKTIHMVTTPSKYTFEPKEIAARSTMNTQPSLADGRPNPSKFLSAGIEEILASSFADNIRSMGKSLRETVASVHDEFSGRQIADLSLPRTADMSKLSRDSLASLPSSGPIPATDKDPWSITQPAFESSWMRDKINELSQMEEDSFQVAESMEARLLADEMAWEQENATIPEMNAKLHQPSPMKGARKPQLKDHVDFSCFSGYLAQEDDTSRNYNTDNGDGNEGSVCSVGHYFNKMSDNLKSMIGDKSPPKRRPLPLIDMTNDIESPRSQAIAKIELDKEDDKENKENALSVSYLTKAIISMDLEASPHNFIHKLEQVQRTKSEHNMASNRAHVKASALPKSYSNFTPKPAPRDPKSIQQPRVSRSGGAQEQQHLQQHEMDEYPYEQQQLADTLSFSESLLDSSSGMPVLPISKTSSPKSSDTLPSSPSQSGCGQSNRLNPSMPTTPAMSTKHKPAALVGTFRVSTAQKLSEEYMDMPSIPRIKDSPLCQKNIFSDRPIAKPNRKRRSSSATRHELANGGKRMELTVPVAELHPRSKSPSNREELQAVSGSAIVVQNEAHPRKHPFDIGEYYETPKSSQPRNAPPVRSILSKSHLSPEPRAPNRSPYSSPARGTTPVKSSGASTQYEYELPVPAGLPSRSASQCSGSTEWSHRGDGTLPLKATHSELSWGSTRLRKSEKKTMQIKNTSNRKLMVKAVIVGPGFQLCGTERNGLLTLQSQECRTITVDFCPTVIGPAIGALSFHPPNDMHVQRVVSLFGYGGEASIKIEGIQKGPSGPFLELGSARNLGRPLEKSFSLYNKGSLPAFARIGIDKKGLDQALLATAVYVQPQRTIIPPNSYAHIKVVFKPRRQEIAKILQKQVDVLSITNLHILWGDEPTRHRIRRNVAMARKNNLHDPKMGALETICHPFGDEQEQDGLHLFSEHVFDTIHELFLTFREYELVLTVDRALDDTMLDLSLADDNRTLFKTMYASSEAGGSPHLPQDDGISPMPMVPVTGTSSATASLGIHRPDSGESWSVRPTVLEFRASTERTKQFVIKSNFYTAQYFELNSNYRQLFRLSPSEGHIRPGQEVVVNVSLQHLQPLGAAAQQPMFVVVYIENEKISIPVKIHYGK
ncbi:uncharacterized protein LOC131294334 [Anopheles ziemanni]|uniref:uncharacterized protein LOC131266182 n=1 Tax=Anopheles coustani TaxID=139045 RepID=UPI00265B6774|nr:uncharacterized protein LOC131266182 [Anopheles coustani]XP_058178363.1 uncharacterized protein LOC131294334 [Anopheles ziemanni]